VINHLWYKNAIVYCLSVDTYEADKVTNSVRRRTITHKAIAFPPRDAFG
jgi:hypothetical protein